MTPVRSLALLALGLLAGAFAERGAAALAGHLPQLGVAVLTLVAQALALLLLASALWSARAHLGRAGRRLHGVLEPLERRLLAVLPASRNRIGRALVIGVTIGLVASFAVEVLHLGRDLSAGALDRFYQLRFPAHSQAQLLTAAERARVQEQVVIVTLDDDTVGRFGWPLPRLAYARLIDRIAAARPASLSFDVALVDPSRDHPDWDAAVGEAARRAGYINYTYLLAATGETTGPLSAIGSAALARSSVVATGTALRLPDLAEILGRPLAPAMVIDAVAATAHGVAMANVVLDGGDDVLRHGIPLARLGERLLPSLALRVAIDALGVGLGDVRVYPGSHIDLGGRRRVPIDGLGRTLLRYHGRHSATGGGPFRYLSMLSLLRSDAAVTLADSPMGEDQAFVIDETTRVRGGAATTSDLLALAPGTVISGVAHYASDPGRIVELAIEDGTHPATPAFEVLDETTLRFTTHVRTSRPLGLDPAILRGRHVLVGSTALAAADVHTGPLGAIPGVEYQATLLTNLLQGDFFRTLALPARVALTLTLALLAALLGSLRGPALGFLLAALCAGAFWLAAFVLFGAGVYVPVVAPGAALGTAYGAAVLLGFRAEGQARRRAEADREFVRRTFGRYLTDQVVDELLGSPDGLRLGGQRRFVTLMMTDLRGFTSMCGTMQPESVVKLLNHYLEAMTRIITRHRGTIDEFIGDAILVAFGAPLLHGDEELRAVACAIEMLNEMAAVNRWNRGEGLPEIEMGIGIHSGEVVMGNIGSELRAKYGIVGATINLTSRVESFTVGGQVLISDATRQRCGERVTVGASQQVTAKGVAGPLILHEAIAVAAPYSVALSAELEALRPPARPLRVRWSLVRDKQVAADGEEASVEALSPRGLELRLAPVTDRVIAALANLQLRILDEEGNARPGELYGKVLRTEVRPGVIYVRLTSIGPELAAVLNDALGK